MAEFLELIETIKAEAASEQKLFGSEGKGIKGIKKGPRYNEMFSEAVKLVADVFQGKKPVYRLMEAMTTDDFPYLFGDILDRQLLANYIETPAVYRNYCKIATVSDFRTVKRFAITGSEAVLDVVKQQQEYPDSKLADAYYSYAVQKYGRVVPFAWESMVNDDLGALQDITSRLGRAARRTEQKFATALYADANGPHASFYTSGNKNIVTSNPVLSTAGLQTAMAILAAQLDADGEPITIDAVHLVVPPALEIVAKNILNAIQLWLVESGGTSNQQLHVNNWMQNLVKLSVDPYIPIITTTGTVGATSWYLFADPGNNRPAVEIGFLRGHTSPEIFIKSPNSMMVGGMESNPMAGDFNTDTIQYKVRHVLGGTREDPKMTVASKGTGS